MNISQIQSQMAFNRQQINDLHLKVVYIKEVYKASDELNTVPSWLNNFYTNKLEACNKRIAKLVKLQKALKRDMAAQQEAETERQRLNRYYTSLYAHFGDL